MKKVLIAFLLLGLFAFAAKADIVVDTGIPTDCYGRVVYGWSETEYQWLAGRFTLSESYNINKIEGYFSDRDSGLLTISIYQGSSVPNHQVQPKAFQVTNHIQIDGEDWYGSDNLNINLASGTYWVAFEPEIGVSTFAAGMPSEAPFPLDEYAIFWPGGIGDSYDSLGNTSLPFGVKIEGTMVPVPAAFWLLSSGLIGLITASRSKNRSCSGRVKSN